MPRVTRRRVVPASPDSVWALISDPYNLPRWWPRTSRVENVDRKSEGKRTQWTQVLETAEGRGVRADFRCLSSAKNERYVWEQQLDGTPFERHLKRSAVELSIRQKGTGTEVSLTSDQSLRGLSRLGSPMMRSGQGSTLEQALDGLEQILGGEASEP